jgi:hypothetical protein
MAKRKSSEDGDEDPVEVRRVALEDLKNRIESLDADGALKYLDDLCAKWHVDQPAASFDHAISIAFHNFGGDVAGDIDVDSPGDFGIKSIDDATHLAELEGISLYHTLRTHSLLDESTGTHAKLKINKILEAIFYGKRLVLAAYQTKISVIENGEGAAVLDDDIDARLSSWTLRFRWFDTKINEVQKLLLYLLDCAMEKGYRKHGDSIYEQILVDGHPSHAWRRIFSIKDFIFAEAQKETNVDAFLNLTGGNNNSEAIHRYLKSCRDFQFPYLERDRSVFSFRNGVYVAREDEFYPYGADRVLPKSIAAAKYFDLDFEEFRGCHWSEIETPAVQSVLDYQGYSKEVANWFYVLIGRMLYEVGKRDGWQCIPFLRGVASAGKSSVTLGIVSRMYDAEDVGTLSNNVERQFGLSAFYDKLIFVAPEIKDDLKLEQAEFQSMCSGENVQIAVKHRDAFGVVWKVPGFLAGNETPGWIDNSGSIQRRVIVFSFERAVTRGDMRLDEKLASQMAAFLVKANRAYLDYSEKWGSTNIWEVLPDYFKNTRNEVAATTNSVEALLDSGDVIFGADKICPFDDFKAALKAFELSNGFKGSKFTADFFRGPFCKYKIAKTRDILEYRGRKLRREYLMGIDLATTVDFGNDL